VALVGGNALLTGCRDADTKADTKSGTAAGLDAPFTAEDIAFLDEIADTILPETSTPGAKAAKTGAFMALIVTDSYQPNDQKVFREGMRKVDEASRKAHNVSFMTANPQQRLTVLEALDREQKAYSDNRDAENRKKSEKSLPDQRKEGSKDAAAPAAAITADPPAHYFRMMKELALLGYFTSEIGYTQAMRYEETPGRFDPCVPYQAGDKIWAGHA
ncbi:MAG: gluconate 2-dehydrogenase subunit 3 family protein, partial [Gemmatimonadaceae bacterium]|nr:gluconate 2-dehydrogenase subunit 3 family protein [Gemmatimonadaceae bacterium]